MVPLGNEYRQVLEAPAMPRDLLTRLLVPYPLPPVLLV